MNTTRLDPEVRALQALTEGDPDAALHSTASSSSVLGTALHRYLAAGPTLDGSVYTDPRAFQAFITGGGNVGLYAAASAALAARYLDTAPTAVLDIGCGDGMALVPALEQAGRTVSRADLVELSPALLRTAVQRVEELALPSTAFAGSAQDFVRQLDPQARWDVAQSTFALHALPEEDRDDVLRALRTRVQRLVVVEFDVRTADADRAEHLRFLASSYEQGLSEYEGEARALVAAGFLMPVLVGQLLPGASRMTYEQTADQWSEQLRRCGYQHVERTELYPYWSSPAFLVTGTGS
ncbi:Methyltransferase domain-containing protein [Jatrophihabitans endophyticus]|uniref:Methyltransferase domain-containing protein n=1 Tax=Jatrophihabitans endophyticus TaxID=1206085 RepID=A0A1M5IHF9_9ACTN|nr:class I SAM-dependent methyltransferase [Jatrophihabitans endophyticus]SHG27691.1 Methyltransferase domain-containing protein [Jatrophihabitans endophyticus]